MRDTKKLPKSHVFNGKKYKLKWRKPYKCWGICDDPTNKRDDRVIMVSPHLNQREFVETLLHEALHAELWCLDEETVSRIGENLTGLLDKCGLIQEAL